MKRLLPVALFLSLFACGGGSTPTAPTQPTLAQVAGNWTGNLQYVQSNGNQAVAVNMVLSQSSATVTGTWAAASVGWSGTIAGTVDTATFTGLFTLSAPSVAGGVCTGTSSISGPAGGLTLRFTGAGFTGSCTNEPITLVWNIQRQ